MIVKCGAARFEMAIEANGVGGIQKCVMSWDEQESCCVGTKYNAKKKAVVNSSEDCNVTFWSVGHVILSVGDANMSMRVGIVLREKSNNLGSQATARDAFLPRALNDEF